jgi:hypothetical protein
MQKQLQGKTSLTDTVVEEKARLEVEKFQAEQKIAQYEAQMKQQTEGLLETKRKSAIALADSEEMKE